MKNEKIVLQISTTISRKRNFKKIAKEQGYTMSGLINKLIDDYIRKNEGK